MNAITWCLCNCPLVLNANLWGVYKRLTMWTCVETHSGMFQFLNEVVHISTVLMTVKQILLSPISSAHSITQWANFSVREQKWRTPTNRIHSRRSFSHPPPSLSLSPYLPLSFHSHIVSLTSHVRRAIIMKLKLFSMADVCPGNNHTEIGFIHLAF